MSQVYTGIMDASFFELKASKKVVPCLPRTMPSAGDTDVSAHW